jgi:GH24 family phage-related lysozyme (muramidase)
MRVSNKGLMAIASHEALVLTTYLDSKRVPTIGIGHTAAAGPPKPTPGLRITEREGMELFGRDIERYAADVREAVKVPVSQHEFDALVSFHFNSGGIKRAALVKALNAGDRVKAAAGFMGWIKPKELIGRRKKEQRLFEKGDYGDISTVLVYDRKPGKARAVPTASLFAPVVDPYPDIKGDPDVWHVQRRLKAMRYNPGGLDGLWGGMTAGAITAFINDRKLGFPAPTSDAMFRASLVQLNEALKAAEVERFTRPIAPERSEATPDEIAKKVPEVDSNDKAQRVGFWTSIGTAISTVFTAIVAKLGDAVEWLTPLKTLAGEVPWFVWVGAALAGSGLIYYVSLKSGEAKSEAIEAYKEGSRL